MFLNSRCRGLILLETYSAAYDQSTLLDTLPKFLTIDREVTGDHAYSMYNLSLKEDWKTSKKYYAGRDSQGNKLFCCLDSMAACCIAARDESGMRRFGTELWNALSRRIVGKLACIASSIYVDNAPSINQSIIHVTGIIAVNFR